MNEMLKCHPRDNLWDVNTNTNFAAQIDSIATTTIEYIDPLIDWLPYHYKKYLPTWHLVRSYK